LTVFKRLFWLLMGAGFGFGVSFWFMRWVRDAVARYTPERVSSDLAGAARQLGNDLKAAVAEGRKAMREREQELRAKLDGRRGTGATATPPTHTPATPPAPVAPLGEPSLN
jgi:hypothetical protein